MQRIKGVDALMYYSESPHASQHVLGLMVLDPATCPDGEFTRDTLAALLLSRFDQVQIFRKKIVKAPLDMAFPALVDDADFRLQNHISHIALPKPGNRQQLADIVSSIASLPLDMQRPLWEMTLIDGFEGGKYSVIVSKTHHCLMDGVGGSEMMSQLLDTQPVSPPDPGDRNYQWTPNTPSLLASRWSELQDVGSTYNDVVTTLGAIGKSLAGKTVKAVGRQLAATLKPKADEGDSASGSVLQREMPATVPRLYFNRALTSARCVAFGDFPLAGVKEIRAALNLTFNDVIIGICTLALRRFLQAHGQLPEGNIVASIPISTRGKDGSEGLNQLRLASTPLPIHLKEPIATLRRTGAILDEIKAAQAADESDGIKLTKLVTPQLGAIAGWLYGIGGLADYVRFLQTNLAISTIPGPPAQLYLGGAKVVSICPVAPPPDGMGLVISAMTYQKTVNFTVNACPDFLPDVQLLGELIHSAYKKALAAVRKSARTKSRARPTKARKKAVRKKARATTGT